MELAKNETRLARLTGYNFELTEKSGVQLARIFYRVTASDKCSRLDCFVCTSGGKRCKQQNVVYRAKYQTCESEKGNGDKGVYIVETGRSLAERCS